MPKLIPALITALAAVLFTHIIETQAPTHQSVAQVLLLFVVVACCGYLMLRQPSRRHPSDKNTTS